ncbi:MAG: cypA [Acidimicrobiaceae bacterium]|nr:cypA [Acidimicrobiaceae bacterium]
MRQQDILDLVCRSGRITNQIDWLAAWGKWKCRQIFEAVGRGVDVDEKTLEALASEFDQGAEGMGENPYEVWAQLRTSETPLHSDQLGGFHILSRYEDVRAAAVEHRRFISGEGILLPPMPGTLFAPLEYDPPLQKELRSPINEMLAPAKVREMEPWIRDRAKELLGRLRGKSEIDLVDEYTSPLPGLIAMQLLGYPDEDRAQLGQWIYESEAYRVTDPARAVASYHAVSEYLAAELIRRRSAHEEGSDDLIDKLLDLRVEDGRLLTDGEMLGLYLNLTFAGLGTTTGALSMALHYLACHQDAQQMFINEPAKLPVAIEEWLRVYTPNTAISRVVSEETDIKGCVMKPGDRVALLWGSGNMDESEFPDASNVLLERTPNRHLAFGVGAHRCAGSHLARATLRIGIHEVLSEFGQFELQSPSAGVWEHHGFEARTMSHLPVRRVS